MLFSNLFQLYALIAHKSSEIPYFLARHGSHQQMECFFLSQQRSNPHFQSCFVHA